MSSDVVLAIACVALPYQRPAHKKVRFSLQICAKKRKRVLATRRICLARTSADVQRVPSFVSDRFPIRSHSAAAFGLFPRRDTFRTPSDYC